MDEKEKENEKGTEQKDSDENSDEGIKSKASEEINAINAETERLNKAVAENENAKATPYDNHKEDVKEIYNDYLHFDSLITTTIAYPVTESISNIILSEISKPRQKYTRKQQKDRYNEVAISLIDLINKTGYLQNALLGRFPDHPNNYTDLIDSFDISAK